MTAHALASPALSALQESDFVKDVSEAQKAPENASLCTTYAQVRGFYHNSIKASEICRETIVDWLLFAGHVGPAQQIDTCGRSFLRLEDPKGHQKWTRLYCHNEFCPTCGRVGSKEHKRRVQRAANRLAWPGILGYIVFTLPKEISMNMPDKDILSDLTKKAWQIVKKNFKTPGGMSRIHLMGEDPGCLHIHINMLFPVLSEDKRGKVPQETLEKVRGQWTKAVNNMFNLNLENTNIFYKFATKINRKVHQIKYVLRPVVTPGRFLTLSDEDRERVLSLRKWHNTRWYGELSNSKYKEYLKSLGIDIEALEEKQDGLLCPVCGERYHVIGIVSEQDVPKKHLRWLDDDTLVDFASFLALNQGDP